MVSRVGSRGRLCGFDSLPTSDFGVLSGLDLVEKIKSVLDELGSIGELYSKKG